MAENEPEVPATALGSVWSCLGFPERLVERMWLLLRGEVVVCRDRIRQSSVSARLSW